MLYITMKDHNTQHQIIRGKQYRYDPDFDAYYRVHEQEGPASKWAWIVICLVLAIMCYCIETVPLNL